MRAFRRDLSRRDRSRRDRLALLFGISLPALLSLGGCATRGSAASAPEIPADAVAATKVMANGDEVTEYRVAGQLRLVRVQPLRGPAYYLQDRNADGRPDEDKVSPVYFKLFEW